MIAEATLALVIERGHRNVTTAEVAERAGVTEAIVLYHFPSKDHLYVAALTFDRVRDEERWRGFFAESPPLDSALAIAGEAGRQASADVSHTNSLQLFVAMAAEACDPDHPAHEWFLAHHRSVRQGFADLLRAMQAVGEAHPGVDPDRFARQLTAVWDGLQEQWLIDPDFDLGNEIAQAFIALTRADAMAAKRALAEVAERL